MKKIINIGLLLCIISGVFFACKDEQGAAIEPVASLAVGPESIVFEQEGGDVTLTINTNRGWVVVKGEEEWYRISGNNHGEAGESNIVTLQAMANENGEVRTSTITVNAGGKEEKLTVSQFGSDPALILPEKKINVKYEGGIRMVSAQSNVAFEVKSLSDWITLVTPAYSSMPSDVYYLNIPENEGDERTGKVLFVSDKGISDTLIVVQEEVKDVLNIKQTEFAIDGLRDELEIEITTSKAWTGEFVDALPEWIEEISPLEGKKGVSKITVSLKSTDITASETFRMKFTCGELSQTVTLTLIPTTARGRDSMALVKLYRSALSTGSDKWDFTKPMNTWSRGLWVNKEGRVAHLGMTNWKFDEFPAEIGILDQLVRLNFAGCTFNGANFPTEFGKLKKLTLLTFWGCPKVPSFPESVKELTALKELTIASTLFDGIEVETAFPEEFMECSSITRLTLGFSTISEIPASLAKLTKLNYLALNNAKLTTIPAVLGQLPELSYLDLNDNQITGEIPTFLFTGSKLITCLLARNKLEGNLPVEIFKLNTLQEFSVSDNNITGEIPEEIVESAINLIYLTRNRLGGPNNKFPEKISADPRCYGDRSWNANNNICPQQEGYGWTDCTL